VRNRPAALHFIRTDSRMRVTMSHSSEVAAKVLNDIDDGQPVSNSDAMYLRFIAAPDEVTLPVPEIAKRILERETEPPTQSKAAGYG
jgi:hypothetical protein